jgi:serine/threonine protein kinase
MSEQHGLTMEEKPGTRFGNYELVRRIDVGGMGEVYLASQLTAFGRSVAIKIIRPDLVHDTTARARFLREAEVGAYLKHEHILSLYDFGELDGRLYLVTPYIEGGTLAARLADRGPLSLVEVQKLFVPLVQAVAYVHRRGVVHRDLKPTNIMLDSEDGEVYVRLIDFGIASLQGQSASPPLTTAGHEIGTIAYMAPERLSGIAAPSNDIFSLGVILHQMLTARMPTNAPPSPNSTIPRLPEPLNQVIRRSVASNLAERYATADELLKGFDQACWQIMGQEQDGIPVSRPGISRPGASRPDMTRSNPAPFEHISLANSGTLPVFAQEQPFQTPSRPPMSMAFAPEDYNAPTTSFQAPQQFRAPTSRPPLIGPPRQRPPKQNTARRHPLLLIVMIASLLLVLIIGGLLVYGYQTVAAVSVAVNFAPQEHVVSQVFSFKANPNAQSVNLAQATIPAHSFTSTQTQTQSGPTSGEVNCSFGFFGCEHGVSPDDVSNLADEMRQGLEATISQSLQAKISAAHGTQTGIIYFSNETDSANPQVGEPGRTVTVTLSLQGSALYILSTDAQNLVHQMLVTAVGHLGPSYQIVDATLDQGTPEVQTIDPNQDVISLSMAAGAVARYQFTPAQLQAINVGLEGKTLTAAEAFLKSQPGVDPTSVSIHFTSGSGQSMPGDLQHIKLIPLNPANPPGLTLTPVAGLTPTATPTDNSTSNNNGDGINNGNNSGGNNFGGNSYGGNN